MPGYNVKYGKNRAFTLFKIFGAIPKILIRIKREKGWLKRFLAVEKPDAVVSDNRYGLYAPGLYSVFITHQLRIRTPFGSWADTLLQRIHYRAIRRFSICWVPDLEEEGSLAGTLSHPGKMPGIPIRYIGLLSRLERAGTIGPGKPGRLSDETVAMAGDKPGRLADEVVSVAKVAGAETGRSPDVTTEVKSGAAANDGVAAGPAACDLLVLLSGPEPQRTIFEKKVLDELASYSGSVVLVRGLPGNGALSVLAGRVPAGVRVYNHLPASALNAVIQEAGIVLSRAGYSTIMDLLKLGKRAILVPTPGQTEQEYLGSYLSGKGIALCREQSTFSLAEALSGAKGFPFTGIRKGEAGIGERGDGALEAADGVVKAGDEVTKDGYGEDTLLRDALRSFLETLADLKRSANLASR